MMSPVFNYHSRPVSDEGNNYVALHYLNFLHPSITPPVSFYSVYDTREPLNFTSVMLCFEDCHNILVVFL